MANYLKLLREHRLSRKGVTLVELIVCMALTSIFAVVCIGLINPIERMYRSTQETGRAQLLADAVVDSLRQECANIQLDDETAVWIATRDDFGTLSDDSVLLTETLSHTATEGDVLVFRRSDNYCEAIYSCFPISEDNKTKVLENAAGQSRSVETLFDSADSLKRGIVHYGYYQSVKDSDGYSVPSASYDYTNPIPSSAYGDYTVSLSFKNIGYAESEYGKIPAYVECDIYVFKGEYSDVSANCVYSRSTALCFTVNGSGQGSDSGSIIPSGGGSSTDESSMILKVVFDGTASIPSSVNATLVLNGVLQNIVSVDINATTRSGSYVFYGIDDVSIDPGGNLINNTITAWGDKVPFYGISSIDKVGDVVTITYKQIEGKLVKGSIFNQNLGKNNGNQHQRITKVIFGKLSDYEASLGNKYVNVSVDSSVEYRLYVKARVVYVLSESGLFNANEDCADMFLDCYDLESIEGLDNVNFSSTTTMVRMFQHCHSMTSFNFPDLVGPSVKNTNGMFYACYSAKEYDFSNWDTSSVTDMRWMFCNTSGVYDVNTSTDPVVLDLSNFSFASCTNMEEMFSWQGNTPSTRNITKIILPEDPESGNVTSIKWMFANCYSLSEIENLNKFDYSNVTAVQGMFGGDVSLETVDLSGINMPKVTSIKEMFSYSHIKNLDMSGANLAGVTSFRDTFINCTELESVDFSNVTSSSTSVQAMFSGCTSLRTLNIEGLVGADCTNMYGMFYNCSSLPAIDLGSNADVSNVTTMRDMCKGCSILEEFDFGDLNDLGSLTTMESMFENCTELSSILNARGIDFSSLTSVNNMFYNCQKLYNLDMRNSKMPKISRDALKNMFNNCYIKNLDMSGTDFSGITSFQSVFENRTNFETIDFSNVTSSATSVQAMFSGCTKLSTLNIEGLVGADCTNMYGMFYNCSSLPAIDLGSNADVSNVTTMRDMCKGCSSLTKFDFGGLNDLGSLTTMESMFENCTELSSISNASGIDFSSLTTVNNMFKNCQKLYDLNMSDSKMPKISRDALKNMFNNCYIKNLDMSGSTFTGISNFEKLFENRTNFENIDFSRIKASNSSAVQMFSGCSNLKTVSFDSSDDCFHPTSVVNLFGNCTSLKTVSMKGLISGSTTNLQGAFHHCTSLTYIDWSDSDFSGATTMKWMFQNCTSLKDLSFINEMESAKNSSAVTDMSFMFENCTGLTDVHGLVNLDFSSVIYIGSIFKGCSSLKTINLSTIKLPATVNVLGEFLTGNTADTLNFNESELLLNSLESEFSNYNNLKYFYMDKASLPNVTSTKSMFYRCNNLNTVSINNVTLNSCTTCASMFSEAKKLETVNMQSFKTPNCTNMEYMFANCHSVKGDVEFSDWDTAKVTTMYRMFFNFGINDRGSRTTTEMVTLNISGFDFDSVTTCKEMFAMEKNTFTDYLRVITFPETATATNLTTMYFMFRFRFSLEDIVNLGGFETSNKLKDTNAAFSNLRSITVIDVSSMDMSGITDARWMFDADSGKGASLTTIYVSPDPDDAISLLANGTSMFSNRTNLVGQNETEYSFILSGILGARIDRPPLSPGLFSVKTT